HTDAYHLSTTEDGLLTGYGEIPLHLREKGRVGESEPVSRGGPIHRGVLFPTHGKHQMDSLAVSAEPFSSGVTDRSRAPFISLRNPLIWRSPAKGINRTMVASPGSRRAAVPAGMSRRMPRAR